MNKKQLLIFSKLGFFFLILAGLFGVVVHTGANHPPLRFPSIGGKTAQFIMDMAQREYKDVSLSLSKQGPFRWDNKKDLGFSSVLGQWKVEADHDAVVYYRRDKDAIWQQKAQSVLSKADRITEELTGLMGKVCCVADSSNGRKLPIYLPENDQEFMQVLDKLCDGQRIPSNKNGSSVINIGPLGCKDNGIVIHPDSFVDAQDYEYVLRKEMARFAYLSSVDFNKVINQQAWFTDGLVEFFAAGDEGVTEPSEEMIESIKDGLCLGEDGALAKGLDPKIGAAFLQYLSKTQGQEKLTELIQDTFRVSLDSAFVASGLDFQQTKQEWINSLRVSEGAEETGTSK